MKLPGQSFVYMDDSTAPVREAGKMSREILVTFPTASNAPALEISKPQVLNALISTWRLRLTLAIGQTILTQNPRFLISSIKWWRQILAKYLLSRWSFEITDFRQPLVLHMGTFSFQYYSTYCQTSLKVHITSRPQPLALNLLKWPSSKHHLAPSNLVN